MAGLLLPVPGISDSDVRNVGPIFQRPPHESVIAGTACSDRPGNIEPGISAPPFLYSFFNSSVSVSRRLGLHGRHIFVLAVAVMLLELRDPACKKVVEKM
jgi:hypothetical protein